MSTNDAVPPPAEAPETPVPVFERPPAVVRFFDATEEAIRSRLAKLTFFQRVFQLDRDWMTRITMLMVVASVFWGIVGAFDIFGFETQVTAFALGQSLHLSNQEIYSSLTLHGIRMLFGFAQQLELALFGIIFVTAFGLVPRHKWAYYLSVLLVNLSMILMEGPFYLFPQFNDNYFPALGWYFYSPLGIRGLSSYVASPLWYIGWIALCVGVILWAAWMLLHFADWWRSHRGQVRRIPPFALFVLATVILIPVSYVTVLASSAWDLVNYFGVGPVDPLANQVLFWFFGHGVVYILFLIPITAFYFLIPIFAKRPVYSYRAAFAAAVIFTILTPVLSIHHLYLTPVPPWSAWLTMALTFLIIIPSAITFFTVWMTTKGVKRGEWQWNAVTLFLLLSFAGTMAGGLTGPDNNSLAFDIDLHNTMFIVSHFHAIALLSIAAGGFAVVYAAFPLLAGRLWYSPRLARAHFVSTAIGWVGLVFFMDLLGSDGILRRSLIFPLTNAVVNDQVWLMVFVIISIGAQLFFVANVLLTLFKGEVLTVQGLSLDEIVRKMAQSTHPQPTVPISDAKFERHAPRAKREGAERTWITVVVGTDPRRPGRHFTADHFRFHDDRHALGPSRRERVLQSRELPVLLGRSGERSDPRFVRRCDGGSRGTVGGGERHRLGSDRRFLPAVPQSSHGRHSSDPRRDVLLALPGTFGSRGLRRAGFRIQRAVVWPRRGRAGRVTGERHVDPRPVSVERRRRGHLRPSGDGGERGLPDRGPGRSLRQLGPGPHPHRHPGKRFVPVLHSNVQHRGR